MDHLCLSCFQVCSLLSCGHLLGKGLTSWLSFVMLNCVFSILDQVWCLIVWIPDYCHLSYLNVYFGDGCVRR